MFRRYLGALILGISGCAVLASLGVWQLQRLEWKEEILSQIDARMSATPIALPEVPDKDAQRFLPVDTLFRLSQPDRSEIEARRFPGQGL